MAELSIFGPYAEALQVLVDTRQDKFNKPWYVDFFPMGVPQMSLNFSAILGESVITAAASVVSRDSETPLRARETMSKLTGEIPAIKVMRKLNESHYRDYMSLQGFNNIDDKTKKNQALQLIWNDTKYVSDAVHKRLDLLVLQALSTGTIDINVDNNPDGIVVPDIDLMMPAANKKQAAVSWATIATAKPLTDIINLVNDAALGGVSFGKVLMDATKFIQFMQSTEVKNVVGTFFGLSAAAKASQTAPLTMDRINEYMTAAKLPMIEVINSKITVEKNGVNTIVNPWEVKNISFVPEGNLGEIKNAFAVEEFAPVEKVNYAKNGRVLISKWKQNEPFGEWTKSELNAFPVITAINNVFIMDTEPA